MSVNDSLRKIKGSQTGNDDCPKGSPVEAVTAEDIDSIFGSAADTVDGDDEADAAHAVDADAADAVEADSDDVGAGGDVADDQLDAAEIDEPDDDRPHTYWTPIPNDTSLRRPIHLALLEMLDLPEGSCSIDRAFEIAVRYDLDGDSLWGAFLSFYRAKVKTTEIFDAETRLSSIRETCGEHVETSEQTVVRGSALPISNYRVTSIGPDEKDRMKEVTVPSRLWCGSRIQLL